MNVMPNEMNEIGYSLVDAVKMLTNTTVPKLVRLLAVCDGCLPQMAGMEFMGVKSTFGKLLTLDNYFIFFHLMENDNREDDWIRVENPLAY